MRRGRKGEERDAPVGNVQRDSGKREHSVDGCRAREGQETEEDREAAREEHSVDGGLRVSVHPI